MVKSKLFAEKPLALLFSVLFVSIFQTSVVAQSNHTVTFTGSSADFNASEGMSAAAGSTNYYVTFDASNLYIGAFRTSGSFASTDNFTLYLDTDPASSPTSGTGSTSAHTYNGVSGSLPFTANYVVHAEQSYQEARIDTASWSTTISGITYNTGSTWREAAIPFSAIGNPDALYLTMWIGQASAIYSNAPGADLGGVSNPTVTDYIGGFGVSSAGCIPVNVTNNPITASISDAVPAAGVTYGKVLVTSASVNATNNFDIAPGGSIAVSGGTLDISGRTIQTGGSTGSGRGVSINYTGGTLTTNSSTTIEFLGAGYFLGNPLTYNGALIARNTITPLGSGNTTIGNGGRIDLRSGSSIVSNALSYSSGSTLAYNFGATTTAGIEWVSNLSSGVGVPHDVVIGDQVANTVVSFGGVSAYRRAAGNVVVSNATAGNGLTLSTNLGGDLEVGGNLIQNGTFTHNNRSITMNGSIAQAISGNLNTSGATNNIPVLIINNTHSSGVTLNSNVLISTTSGDVLSVIASGPLQIGAGVTLTLSGNGGNVRATGGVRTINLDAANSLINITGTKTFASSVGGTFSITSDVFGGTLALNAAVNFGSSVTSIGNNTYLQINAGGSVATNAPTYATGATLVYNQGGTVSAGLEWTANSTAAVGVPHHVLVGNGVNTTLNFGASTQFRHTKGGLTISASSTHTLSSAGGGNLQMAGNFSNSGTFNNNGRDVSFVGSSAQQLTGATSFQNLILNNSSGLTLNNAVTVAGVLTLTSGSITLGSNNLTLTSTTSGAITGTFSATRMIITNGTGQLIRAIATGGLPITYNFPVGENTGTTEYSPASFVFSANGASRNIGVRVLDSNHPQLDNSPTQTDYTGRYWAVTNSAASTYTYTPSFTYPAADLTGAESNIRLNMYNGSAWTHVTGSSSAGNVLTTASAVSNTTLPLGATAEFTGRVNNGVTYTWNQTGTASFVTPGNWTPTRSTTSVNDILVFSNNATITVTNVPTQTIGKLQIQGTTNVSFTSAADVTLTIAGSNGADLSIASGATMQMSSTGGSALTLAYTNACTADISGVLTINGNTANDNTYNATNSISTVAGSLNNLGIVTSSATSLIFSASSNYRHNYTTTTGNIPVAAWNTTSTCTIQGYTSNTTAPGNLDQAFGNFTWNCTGQTGNINLGGDLQTINGNFTVSSAGGNDLRLSSITSTLNVGGNFTISGTNTEFRIADANGTYAVEMNVAGNFTLATSSARLNLNNGNGGTDAIFRVGGNFTFSSGTIEQTSGSVNPNNLIEFNGTTAQTVNIGGTISDEINFRLDNAAGMNLTGTIPILDDCTFYRKAGSITGGTITYGASGSTLVYEGSAPMTTSSVEWPTSNDPENVTINATSTVSLHAARTVETDGVFTNQSGVFILGSNDLTISNTTAGALTNSSPSATNMIAASGSGQLKRAIPNAAIDLYFYIGDVTGTTEYSGFRLNFSNNSLNNRVIGVRVVDDTSASLSLPYSPIDYLSRHWIVTLSSNSGSYSYDPSMSYDVAGDVNGTENNLQVAAFPSGATSWNHYNTNLVSPTITKTGADLTQGNFSLNNAQFTGRTPVKYWNGSVSSAWAVSGNWTPSGIPTSTDNIDINGNASNPCVLSTTTTINHLTLSDGGDFTLSSGASLTVAGNFTYNPLAAISFDCASTFTLSNTTFNQTIPALTYGNLNLGAGTRTLANADTIRICGNYTPTSGTLTSTGSTVEFMGAAAQGILSNSTNFNNLIISNTSANVSSGNAITVNGNLSVLANARLNKTSGTLTIASGATATIDGFLRAAATVTTTGSLAFSSTGAYEHNYTTSAGAIPTATWNSGSTCNIIGYTSNNTAPTGLTQTFHHFVWDCNSQNANITLNAGLSTVNGNFELANTGSGVLRMTGNTDETMNIGGNFIHSGGNLTLVTGNASFVAIVVGDYIQTGGDMDFCSNNSGDAEIRIAGNYSRTGTGSVTTTGLSPNGLYVFNGTTQTITDNSSGSIIWANYSINNGSTTRLLTDLDLDGSTSYVATVTVNSGGTLDCDVFTINGAASTTVNVNTGSTIITANTDGLNTSSFTGSVQTATRSYNSGATYVFDGTANQNTGNFWTGTSTVNTVANLTINNTASLVTMNSGTNVTVTNSLNFASTNTAALDVQSQTIYVSNTATAAVTRTGLGHVIGNLRRAYTTGTNTYNFQVGTSTAYAPVSMAMTASAAGSLIAKATDGAHPNMATDGLSQTAYVNRYWSLSYVFGNITSNAITFNYVPADLVGGATASTLRLKRYSAGWTAPTFSSITNQLTATGLNNTTTYGDFFAAADCSSFDATITPSASTTICNGSSVDLTASSNITGSTYAWSPASGLSSSTGATVTASPSTTTTYTVTATSPQSCVTTEIVTVTVSPRPTGVLGGNQTVCTGGTATLYVSTTGSGNYSGTLNPGAIAFSGSGSFITIDVTPSSTTTYTLATLSDDNCSSISGDLSGAPTVVVHPLPTATISGTTSVCEGLSSTITINGTPDSEVTYTINGGSNLTVMLDGSGVANLNTGIVMTNLTYALVSIDDFVCQNSISGTATITKLALPDATITGSTSVCSGSSALLVISGTPGATVTVDVNGVVVTGAIGPLGQSNFPLASVSVNTTVTLVSITNGTCTQTLGVSATVTVYTNTYYQDSDGDGFGNPAVSTTGCTAPVGYVSNNTDCCDTNADVNPLTEWWVDLDGDGFGGFVMETGCISGVTCSPGTWPANYIPYYPGAHAGAPYVVDCNDNYSFVYPGAIELCGNNTDDDCDGTTDEGCSTLPNDSWVNATTFNMSIGAAVYPNCFNYNCNMVNADISAQGNPANVAVGGGRDVWYKFVAQSTAVQIKLTPNGFDGVIELQNSSAVQIDVENVNNTIGGMEVLNIGTLTVGQTYYVGVRNYNATNTGTFTICASPLMPSGCALNTPVGGFTLCSSYKAIYRGASSYTFNFTGTGGSAPLVTTSTSSTGLIPMNTPILDLRYGGIYNVRVDANYTVYNGLNVMEPTITVLGSISSPNCTGIAIASQPNVEVRANQRCPQVLNRNVYLNATPVAGNGQLCGAITFTYEFTKVTDCTGATTLPTTFTVTTANSSPFLILAAAFPGAQANVGYWNVRIRPNFVWGAGNYGPTQTIQVSGTSASQMLQENEGEEALRVEDAAVLSTIYPNPNNGDAVNINLYNTGNSDVNINIYDGVGQLIYSNRFAAEGSLNKEIRFENALTSGIYFVEISTNDQTFTERMIVGK